MMRITEKRDVQDRLINILIGIGWYFIPRGDFQTDQWRGADETNPFLSDILRKQLATLNGWRPADTRIDQVIRQLSLLSADLAGHEEFVHWLRGEKTAYDPKEKINRNVLLIDYDNLDNNVYLFTEEMSFIDRDRRRMDIVLFVNGLPVLLVENKNPASLDPGLEGFDQVQTLYTEQIPGFIKYPIPFAVPASRLEYGATWNSNVNAFYRWKPFEGGYVGLEQLCKGFFDKRMVLRLIQDYTIFYRSDDAVQKFILRPHQIRTVQKIVDRVVSGLEGRSPANTGLEWHTQGSGKTLTMIVAAHLLRRHSALKNPTLLIVVDRIELESQMMQSLEAFDFGSVRNPGSKRELRRLLKSGWQGLIVTTIHKFDCMPANVITKREVVILIDEAHRSQEGELGIYLSGALPNAFRFGFTGTPIDRGKVGRGTFELFGRYDSPHGYQDKYSLNESIEDKTTVRLYYTLAPSDIWVDKLKLEEDYRALLDEFLKLVDETGVASIDALNQLLKRADKLMAVLKSPERIGAITEHIAEHFRESVLPLGFKALVVTPDREACALYKDAFNNVLPADWTQVVYSSNNNDKALLRQHHLSPEAEQRIRRAFCDPEATPKILIVTEKLLTGYDAPVAYAMYLDKPLRDHTLLQAIARVNRPYENKENGLIVDYIGIFENLQRALSFDPTDLTLGLIDLEELKEQFSELLEKAKQQLVAGRLENSEGRIDRLIDHFFDATLRDEFFETFKHLQTAYEIISPDAFLRPYIDEYATIVDIYRTLVSFFDPNAEENRLLRELCAKTESLIAEHVETAGPVSALPLYAIDENIAAAMKADNSSDQVKVINLYRTLRTHIEEKREEHPFLLSIATEVEEVIEKLKERQISTELALQQLVDKVRQVSTLEEERKASDLDNVAFSMRMVIQARDIPDASDELATQLSQYLQAQKGWRFNPALERKVRRHLYKIIRPILPPTLKGKMKMIADEIFQMHKINL